MQLLGIEIEGLRRFRSQTYLKALSKLTAVVGPNESGKSSLLRVAEAISIGNSLSYNDLSRGLDAELGRASADFLVEPQEAALLGMPTGHRVRVTKTIDSDTRRWDVGTPKGLFEGRSALRARARQAIAETARAMQDQPAIQVTPVETAVSALATRGLLDEEEANYLIVAAETLRAAGIDDNSLAGDLVQHAQQTSSSAIQRQLDDLAPAFVHFSDSDRNLRTNYQVNRLTSDRALSNLAALAGLNLGELQQHAKRGNTGAAETLIRQANDQLQQAMVEVWSQHPVNVQLWCDARSESGELLIHVASGDGELFRADERSSGLLWFIALFAFLRGRHRDLVRPPVLLIDEAETHLHYDAQADLVNEMLRQSLTSHIIYTTHSAGCLPPNLANVRTVVPLDERTSKIDNYFWSSRNDGRVSSMIIGMGASSFAFTRSRSALITEGPSDFLWLPTILAEVDPAFVTSGIQVVPGLSWVSLDQLAELEREAGRVVYLVDDDPAGIQKQGELIAIGVSESRIIVMPGRAKEVEDLVDRSVLSAAINAIAAGRRLQTRLQADEIPETKRGRFLDKWIESNGLQVSKVDVAEAGLQLDLPILDTVHLAAAKQLLKRIQTAFL